jgi:hypothetical protein
MPTKTQWPLVTGKLNGSDSCNGQINSFQLEGAKNLRLPGGNPTYNDHMPYETDHDITQQTGPRKPDETDLSIVLGNEIYICDISSHICDTLNCDIPSHSCDKHNYRRSQMGPMKTLDIRTKMLRINSIVEEHNIFSLSKENIQFVTDQVGIKANYLKKNRSAIKSAIDKAIKLQRKKEFELYRGKFTPLNYQVPNTKNNINDLFKLFDRTIFSNKLTRITKITIKNKTGNKAGESIYSEGQCEIILSKYYLTDFDKLTSTLLHEMCHCAQWVINDDSAGGADAHNNIWQKWVEECKKKFPNISPITAYHNW